ncbi:unnamed protein product [Tilletia controversa]|nr:unnamed protein product [Tilletia controversa]
MSNSFYDSAAWAVSKHTTDQPIHQLTSTPASPNEARTRRGGATAALAALWERSRKSSTTTATAAPTTTTTTTTMPTSTPTSPNPNADHTSTDSTARLNSIGAGFSSIGQGTVPASFLPTSPQLANAEARARATSFGAPHAHNAAANPKEEGGILTPPMPPPVPALRRSRSHSHHTPPSTSISTNHDEEKTPVLGPTSPASPVLKHSVSEDTGAQLLRRHLNASTSSVVLSPRSSGKASSLYGTDSEVGGQPSSSNNSGIGLGLGLRLRPAGSASLSYDQPSAAMSSSSSSSTLGSGPPLDFSPRTAHVLLAAAPVGRPRGRRSSSASRTSGIAGSSLLSGNRPPSISSAAGAPSSIVNGSGVVSGVGGRSNSVSSTSNLRTRVDILANANSALANHHHHGYAGAGHRSYIFATPSPPAHHASMTVSPLPSPGGGHGSGAGGGGAAGGNHLLAPSPGPSPSPMVPLSPSAVRVPRARSASTITTSSSIGGSVGHGSVVHSPALQRDREYRGAAAASYYMAESSAGAPVFGDDGPSSSGSGSGLNANANAPHRRSYSGMLDSTGSLDAPFSELARSSSRSPGRSPGRRSHDLGPAYPYRGGGGSGSGSDGRLSSIITPSSGSAGGAYARNKNRLSLPDAGSAGYGSSSTLSLPLRSASPRQVTFSTADLAAGASYSASASASASASGTWYANSPGSGTSGNLYPRSPFASASGNAGRMQPIPATAPPSEDGGSSPRSSVGGGDLVLPDDDGGEAEADGPGAGTVGRVGTGTGTGTERRGERRLRSDSAVLGVSRVAGAGHRGLHGVDSVGSSGSPEQTTLPRSPRLNDILAAGIAGGDTSTSTSTTTSSSLHSPSPSGRNNSPVGGTAGAKAKRRGRKALTEQLKRRSKRMSAHVSSSAGSGGILPPHPSHPPTPRSISGSSALSLSLDPDEGRRGVMSRGEWGFSDPEESDSEGDEDEDGGEGGAEAGAEADADESDVQTSEDQAGDESDSNNKPNATATATATVTTRKHRAYTSPVHKLADASTSTLDFGSQLGSQEGGSGNASRRTSVSGGMGTRTMPPPTSPLLLPSSPVSPRLSASTATASGVFSSSSRNGGARRVVEAQMSPVLPGLDGDSSSNVSPSRTGTSSVTTPRMAVAVLGAESALGVPPSGEQGRTTPVPVNHTPRSRSANGNGLRSPSVLALAGVGTGGEDEDEDAFFDANESGVGVPMSPVPAVRGRALAGSPEMGRVVNTRPRGSTMAGVTRRMVLDGQQASASDRLFGSSRSGGSDSLGSYGNSSTLSLNLDDTGSLVNSSFDVSFSTDPNVDDGARTFSLEDERSLVSASMSAALSGGSSSSSPPGSPTGSKEWDVLRRGAGGSEEEAGSGSAGSADGGAEFRPLLGGRAGDPLSTATLRQDASLQAKLEGLPMSSADPGAGLVLSRSSDLRDSLDRLGLGLGVGGGSSTDSRSSSGSSASAFGASQQQQQQRPSFMIRTRTGSMLGAAREMPQMPPPLAPVSTGQPMRAYHGVTPIVIESPATPETSTSSTFGGPMEISTGMPSPDLQLVEPRVFGLRPHALDQDTIRGRPRGASMGAVPGPGTTFTPLRPSILRASTSSLTPAPPELPYSPGLSVEMLLSEDEGASGSSGGGGAHRRSGSSGRTGGVDGSSSSHHHNNSHSHSRDRAMSAGISDRTTNTSHSRSAHSRAATDVSGSDTSVSSAHEADPDPDLEMSDVPEAEVPNFARRGSSRNGKEKSLAFHPSVMAGSMSSSASSSGGGAGLIPDGMEGGGAASVSIKNRARARSLGVASQAIISLTPTPGQTAAASHAAAAAAAAAGLAGAAAASAGSSSSAAGVTTRSRSGSTASLHRQAQLPLRSSASFVLAVVGHRSAGKSTVIKKGLKQYGLSKPNSLSEKVTSYSTMCLVDHSERTIEVLEIDAAVLLNGPTKRFSWPKFLPSIDAVILCYDASEVSSFRSMSELLENFSVHGVRTVMLACKSDVEPKALNPYYASEMAAMYNVGLAECTSHTEEGRKRMRNCFSYLVKGVAKARAGKSGGRSVASRQASQVAARESDPVGADGLSSGAVPAQLSMAMNSAEGGRMRGYSVPNVRHTGSMKIGAGMVTDGGHDAASRAIREGGEAFQPVRKLSSATNDSEPMSMSNSDDEGSSDQRHRSMMLNAQLGLQSAKSAGGYVSVDELYDKFFYSAVSNKDPAFATTFMIFYRGFAKPINLLMQAITRFEVLTTQEKSDEEVIRYSLIRMVTFLREWVQDYPGDLSGPETYPTLMNFFYRLLEHRHCADVVRAAEFSFMAVAGAPDMDAAWSVRLDSHRPSSVAADYPPLNIEPGPGSTPPPLYPGSVLGGSDRSLSVDTAVLPSLDVSHTSPGRPRADSGSVMASPASLAESYSSGAIGGEKGRLTANSVLGRDRSSSTATSASYDRQPSLGSSESNTLLNPGSSIASMSTKVSMMSQDPATVKARVRAASDALLDIEDTKIAQELTVMAWSIFMNIKPRDLLRHALVPPEQRPDGPCMQEIRHFNYISAWIVNMILAQSKLKNRSRLLERFMNVAVRIRNENDYATLYCIIGALESQAIYRLGNTWNAISEKPVLKQYHSLTKLMSHTKSYASYRLALQNSNGRTIPHLGVIYQDLVSISAGNPSKTPLEGSVHWRKFQLMDDDVSNFIACQQCSDAGGHSDPALQQHIMNLPVTAVEDESLMERSKQLEPNATRRTDEAWISAFSRKSRKLFASSSGAT